jgi:hypothetical protein
MSIPNYDVREEYVGLGNLNEYTFSFKILALTQIIIRITDQNFNLICDVRGDDIVFLANVAFDPWRGGGTVTLVSNLALDYKLTLLLANDAPTQPSEFRNKDDFTLGRFESALDFIAAALQRADYLVQRAIKIGDDLVTEQPFNTQLPITSTDPMVQDNVGKVVLVGADNASFILGPNNTGVNPFLSETQQLIANDQVAPAPITSMMVDGSKYIYAEFFYSIYRTDGITERRETGKLSIEFLPIAGTWRIASRESSFNALNAGPNSITVTTAAGIAQINYVSDNFAGQTTGKMRWKFSNTIGVEV